MHGDDVVFGASDDKLAWCEKLLKTHYICKSILNRAKAPTWMPSKASELCLSALMDAAEATMTRDMAKRRDPA